MSNQEILDRAFAEWQELPTYRQVSAFARFFGHMDGHAKSRARWVKEVVKTISECVDRETDASSIQHRASSIQ